VTACLLLSCLWEREIPRNGWREVTTSISEPGCIAIVDDDEPLREALGSVMKAAGFSTRTFGSAEEFLGSDWRTAACLILDVRLPGMSGIELQKHLSQLNPRIPIIFVTGHGDDSLRDSLLKAGAEGFLNKPVRSGALLAAIDAALARTLEKRS
jgi:two-component system, LuxR family, response regulator FixJ